MNQGVEGSERAPGQLKAFYFPSRVYRKTEKSHMCGKQNYFGVYARFSSEYHVDDPPRLVLDKLEKMGFRVLTMTGVGQTLVWCLHKETE